jgi:hypothetical protein
MNTTKSENKNGLKSLDYETEETKSQNTNDLLVPNYEEERQRGVVFVGVLRKKGLIFYNERKVELFASGLLVYYHFDKLHEALGNIDLKKVAQIEYKFVKNDKENNIIGSCIDDELRIETELGEQFIFRSSRKFQKQKNSKI